MDAPPWTPPAAMVERATVAVFGRDEGGDEYIYTCHGKRKTVRRKMSAALAASGIGELVRIVERLVAVDRSCSLATRVSGPAAMDTLVADGIALLTKINGG